MKRYCFAIDVGGTSVKFGLFDIEGVLLEQWSIPTNTAEKGIHIIPEIAASVNEKRKSLNLDTDQFIGAGIGIPGQITEDGIVPLAENLGWIDVALTKTLENLTGLSVYAENDANLAALGEIWKGSAKGCQSMMLVTLGTGIGCGIVVKDQIISGATGAAGEIGHMHIEDRMTEQCTCGHYGCLEQLASATGLCRMGKWALQYSDEPSLLRQEEVSAKTIFDAVRENDPLAVRIAEQFGEYMGRALANCTCLLNPEMILIGGGVSKAGNILIDYIRKYYNKYAFIPCMDTEFRLAELGNDAGIYGAARLVLKEYAEEKS